MKITKTMLTNQLAADMQISKKEAKKYVNWFIETLMKSIIAGYEISLPGFGKFFSRKYRRYVPLTEQEHDIVRIVFHPSRKLKKAMK